MTYSKPEVVQLQETTFTTANYLTSSEYNKAEQILEMTSYGSYSREPALARSPTERDTWASRDDSKNYDRPERSDNYYRTRSPGT